MIPGLDHDGDPVLYVELHFKLVERGVVPKVLIQSGPAVREALWALGERRFPHLRYDFHANQQVLASEEYAVSPGLPKSMNQFVAPTVVTPPKASIPLMS